MNVPNDSDRSFHDNLLAVGRCHGLTPGPSPELVARCRATLSAPLSSSGWFHGRALRRPALFSTIGLAAALALAVALIYPGNGGPAVQAAVVLGKLSEQAQTNRLLEVVLDSVQADEVTANGTLQIADKALVADLRFKVIDESEPRPLEADVSLSITENGGWILVRRLQLPDPKAQVFLDMFLTPGGETLLVLPSGEKMHGLFGSGLLGEFSELEALRRTASTHVAAFVREVLQAQSDTGAVVTQQPDGTMLLSIHVKDAQTLEKLLPLLRKVAGKEMDGDAAIDVDEAEELVGCSVRIVYDPATQLVRSFSISDVAGMTGTVTISLRGGEIDPALLDMNRVTKANTRVIDLGALLGSFEALEHVFDGKE